MKSLENPRRGCGFLKDGALYLRAERSPEGTIPSFVWFDPPIPFLEQHFRTWKEFNGLQFELACRPFVVMKGPNETSTWQDALKRFAKQVVMALGEKNAATEIGRHVQRLRMHADTLPQDLGHIDEAWISDLIMWVGETHYPTPESFVKEALIYGLNKRIPLRQPPRVLSGRTKLYLLHPNVLLEENEQGELRGPALFGFSYLTGVSYTIPKDRRLPKWIEELKVLGEVDIVDIEPETEGLPEFIPKRGAKKIMEELGKEELPIT